MKAPVEVRVPFENVNDPTARVVGWKVESGGEVREGDIIAELENSKAVFPVVSPIAGFVEYSWLVGEEVTVGERLFSVHSEPLAKPAIGPSAPNVPAPISRLPVFSRKARELVAEFGIEPSVFSGLTLVNESDVRRLACEMGKVSTSELRPEKPGNSSIVETEGDRIPLDRAKVMENRKLIAANEAALTSTVFYCCPRPVPRLPVILYEAVQLLTKFRYLNAGYVEDSAFLYRHVHAGFAVDMGRGLKVLVIRNAEALGFSELNARFEELLINYSTDKLSLADVTGSTFTVTDLAQDGVFAFAPLLNSAQAITIGVGANGLAGGLGSGFMLSCTFDHRLVGGREVARFMDELNGRLAGLTDSRGKTATEVVPCCCRCGLTPEKLRTQRAYLLPCAEPQDYLCTNCLFAIGNEKSDLRSEKSRFIPDWFYERNWRRKNGTSYLEEPGSGNYLIWTDRFGLGNAVAKALEGNNRRCIIVEPGAEFAKLAVNRYRVNVKAPADYHTLMSSLRENGLIINQILHLGAYNEDCEEVSSVESLKTAQRHGFYSVLFLIQALVRAQSGQPARLLAVSSQAQAVSAMDGIAYEKSTIGGLIKSINLEISWLQCSHLDLSAGQIGEVVQQVLRELRLLRSEAEVAYRDGHRFVPVVARVSMLRQKVQEFPLKSGGLYLLTGGLGGIGTALAEFLIKELHAKLIIIGRTVLPGRMETPFSPAEQTTLARRAKNLSRIEAAGAEFVYEAADVCDLETLRKVVASAESRWNQRLSGIFHFAGEGSLEAHWKMADQRKVERANPELFETMFRAKLYGTWTLWQLIDDLPDAVFVGFSSVYSVFGGASLSAQSAADSFLDACCSYKRHVSHPKTYCFNWSLWNEVGMSEQNPGVAKQIAKEAGYQPISVEQGWYSLLAGLYRHQRSLIIGLGEAPGTQGNTAEDSGEVQGMVAYFTSDNKVSQDKLQRLEVKDRFQTPSKCEFRQVRELTSQLTGENCLPELAAAESAAEPENCGNAVPSQNVVERHLIQIWQELLKVSPIGIHENFFKLGGYSLLAIQLVSRIREIFKIELPLVAVFESPTIVGLSARIGALQRKIERRIEPTIRRLRRDQPLGLSYPQEQLWILYYLQMDSCQFHIPQVQRINGPLRVDALEQAINEVSRRHEILRTTYQNVEAGSVQVIHDYRFRQLPVLDLEALEELSREVELRRLIREDRQRRFDLERGPVWRTTLVRLTTDRHIILNTVHHIATDFYSAEIWNRETRVLYNAFSAGRESPLAELPIQYADYAAWQRNDKQRDGFQRHLEYSKRQLAGMRLIQLPTDYPRPDGPIRGDAVQQTRIHPKLVSELKKLDGQGGVTLFMAVLSGLIVLMNRNSGDEDFSISVGGAGRTRIETEGMIGFFANTLLVRVKIKGDSTVAELVEKVKASTLEAYDQNMPWHVSVEAVFRDLMELYSRQKDLRSRLLKRAAREFLNTMTLRTLKLTVQRFGQLLRGGSVKTSAIPLVRIMARATLRVLSRAVLKRKKQGSIFSRWSRTEIEAWIRLGTFLIELRPDLLREILNEPQAKELTGLIAEFSAAFGLRDTFYGKKLEWLLEKAQPGREAGRNRAYIMLNFFHVPDKELEAKEMTSDLAAGDAVVSSSFDLRLNCAENNQGLKISALFNRDLFKPETIDRLLNDLKLALESFVQNPAKRISELVVAGRAAPPTEIKFMVGVSENGDNGL